MPRTSILAALGLLLNVGCGDDRGFAGRYSMRSADGKMLVLDFDSQNQVRDVQQPDTILFSYQVSGDTLFLSSNANAIPFVRYENGYRFVSSTGVEVKLSRIADR